jgi:ligand-binding sensor domain-containing protein
LPTRIFIILYFLLFLTRVSAQRLDIVKYSPEESLPFSYAYNMAQDQKGFLWFSAGNEVYNYTGAGFSKVPVSQKSPVSFINKINAVKDQLLFFSTEGVYRLAKDSIEWLWQVPNEQVIDIIFYDNRWLTYTTSGIYFSDDLNVNTPSIVNYPPLANLFQDIFPWKKEWLVSWQLGKEIIFFNLRQQKMYRHPCVVVSLSTDRNGELFYVEKGAGLKKITGLSVNGLAISIEETLYATFNVPTVKTINQEWDDDHNCIISLSNNGLLRIGAGGQQKLYDSRSGLPEDMQSILLIDRENNYWVNATNGLIKIRSRNYARFTTEDGLASNAVSVFYDSTNGVIWTTGKRGINKIINDSILLSYRYDKNEEGLIHVIPSGKQLYVFYRHDAFIYSESNGPQMSTRKLFSSPERLIDITRMPGGDLLMSVEGGLKLYHHNSLQSLPSRETNARCLYVYGNYIIAGDHKNGIALYKWYLENDSMRLQWLDSANHSGIKGIPDPVTIRSIMADHEGNIWIGTRINGIFRFTIRNEKFLLVQHIGRTNQFEVPNITSFTEDRAGLILVNTSKGIYEIEKKAGNFVISPSHLFPKGVYSLTLSRDQNGNYWYGSSDGLLKIMPAKKNNSIVYNTYITHLINNRQQFSFPATPAHLHEFSYANNSAEIFFSSNYFTDEKKVLYSYSIGNKEDSNWSIPSPAGSVNLLSLQPGHYFFKVKAILPDGTETLAAAIDFRIAMPFWKTWWFYLLCVAVIGLVVYYLYRTRIDRIKKEQALRNKIARDLHDDIGSTLSGVKLYSSLALQKMDVGGEAAGLVQQINEKTNTMMDAMSDIVWSINPKNDSLQDINVRMREYAAEMLEPQGIAYSFNYSQKINTIKLDVNLRKDIFLLFKETINNILRHSDSTEVTIRMLVQNNKLKLSIQDNGKGFDEKTVKKGNGLYNLSERTRQMKGNTEIRSQPGHGTFIQFILPIT